MRLTAFFKLYKICILLHRCNLKIFAKNRFEKTAIFVEFQQKNANVAKFAKFVKIQKFQLENMVDFEKCCKTHIFLQRSVPIQPKTSEILLRFCRSTGCAGRSSPPAPGTPAAAPGARPPPWLDLCRYIGITVTPIISSSVL